jgi:hypothetical protein
MIIDEAGAGLVVECPECGHDTTVPKTVTPKPGPDTKPAGDPKEDRERTVALKWVPPPPEPPHLEPKK